MGYFNADEADQYGSSGGTDFFFLKNDGDAEDVRFMYNDMSDVRGLAIHEVEVDGKDRYVSCLRNAGDPVDVCPLCAAGYPQKAKLFIPLYVVADDAIKIWERGPRKWLPILSNLIAHNNPLVSTIFEIKRSGKPGDNKTEYTPYPVQPNDGTTMEDLPEVPEVLGGLVLDKTADDMDEYLQTGNFPIDEEAAAPPARNIKQDARRTQAPARGAAPQNNRRPAAGAGVVRRPGISGKESKF